MNRYDFISELITNPNKKEDNSIVFSIYDGVNLTNVASWQFRNDILKAAGFFCNKKIIRQHIAIAAENGYDWLVIFFGIACSGNIAVLLNQDLTRDILKQQCGQADVSVICHSDASASGVAGILDDGQYFNFSEIKTGSQASRDELPPMNPEETMIMMFTSGTTGKSKIAEFSFNNINSYIEDTLVLPFSEIKSILLCLPLFHIYGLLYTLAWIKRGATVGIGRGMRYLLSDMPVMNPQFVALVPAAMESIVKVLKNAGTEEERQKYIGKNLKSVSVGGAGSNLNLCREIMNFGIEVQSAYGMTESAGTGTWCILNEENMGSIGKPYGKAECRIEDGELLLKSPSIMKGYYNDPEETAKIIVDGWLHTGDLAYCNSEGYYYLTGRKKNVIILSNGENVNPEEIEAKMYQCRDIIECIVYSDGVGIAADVYTRDKEKVIDYVRTYNESIPLYRRIHKVNYFSAPLEKTGSGKIKRK